MTVLSRQIASESAIGGCRRTDKGLGLRALGISHSLGMEWAYIDLVFGLGGTSFPREEFAMASTFRHGLGCAMLVTRHPGPKIGRHCCFILSDARILVRLKTETMTRSQQLTRTGPPGQHARRGQRRSCLAAMPASGFLHKAGTAVRFYTVHVNNRTPYSSCIY